MMNHHEPNKFINEVENSNDEKFRSISSIASKLEGLQSNLESVIDFFATHIVKLHAKLCNECLNLFSGPTDEFKLERFRKAEELVWKRVYHDIYRFQRARKQRIKNQGDFLMESHFMSGIGFYTNLIVQLRVRYNITLTSGLPEPLNLTLMPLDAFPKRPSHHRQDKDAPCDDANASSSLDNSDTGPEIAQEWATQAIYRSLVYMGDLARYLSEVSAVDHRNLSFHFYRSASLYQPSYGLPYNQLATLSGSMNHNLGAIANFMRCCLRKRPFEAAEINMKKIFELNEKYYCELEKNGHISKVSEVLSSKNPGIAAESMIRTTIVKFIKLTSNLWSATSGKVDITFKSEISNQILPFFEILREALELDPIIPDTSAARYDEKFNPISGSCKPLGKPRYISPSIMYEFCNISLMLLSRCQRLASSAVLDAELEESLVNLVNTIALNLLHYSTSKCQKMIMSKIQELRVQLQDQMNQSIYQKSRGDPWSKSDSSSGSQKSTENVNSTSELPSRKTLNRLRQRRAANNYDRWKPTAIILHCEDTDMSELEETALSTIDALDISSDMSDDMGDQDLIDLGSSSDDGSRSICRDRSSSMSRAPIRDETKRRLLRPTRSHNYECVKAPKSTSVPTSQLAPDLLTGEISEGLDLMVKSQSSVNSNGDMDGRYSQACRDEDPTCNMSSYELAMKYLYIHTYLPTIKVFCDWLLSNGSIIGSNLQSFCTFYAELDDLVSLQRELQEVAEGIDVGMDSSIGYCQSSQQIQQNYSETYRHNFEGPEWRQKYPLSCDFPLLGLECLSNAHQMNIDFTSPEYLNDSEAGFVATQCLLAFFSALRTFIENGDHLTN